MYHELKNQIITGKLTPGYPLNEVELSSKFEVSRTPIRDAIKRLELDGLVTISPFKGARVVKLSLDDMLEIARIRKCLEGLAARLTSINASDYDIEKLKKMFPEQDEINFNSKDDLKKIYVAGDKLHKFIIVKSGSLRLIKIIENIYYQFQLIRINNATIPGRHEQAYCEHLEILKAICERDPNRAEKSLHKHIDSIIESFMRYHSIIWGGYNG